jgi:glycosyltransferase involved in cell wall biosynthesis
MAATAERERLGPVRDVGQGRPIWMVTARFHPAIGGSEFQVRRMAKELRATGRAVHVLTRRHWNEPHPPLAPTDFVDGVPVVRVASRGPGRLGSFLYVLSGLWYLLRHGRGGIYHAHDTGLAAWLAILAATLFRGRSVVKLRTGRLGYERRYASLPDRINLLAVLRLADRLIVVNSEVRRYLEELGVDGRRVAFVPNGIDTDIFVPDPTTDKNAGRRRLGIDPEVSVILWVGRVDPVKGLDLLLRSWAGLPAAVRRGARLVLVGEGGESTRLRAMASDLGLDGSLAFPGSVTDVRPYYWCADIFVLPSRSEGMSNAMLEAMACGVPVIASNVGGAPDLIEHGSNGLLFETESEPQLAACLSELLHDPARRSSLGQRARATIVASASLDASLDKLIEVYEDVAAA